MSRPDTKRQATINLAALARQHTENAVGVLVAALEDPDTRIRLDAVRQLLDRGYGKPAQSVELAGDAEAPIAIHVITGVPRDAD